MEGKEGTVRKAEAGLMGRSPLGIFGHQLRRRHGFKYTPLMAILNVNTTRVQAFAKNLSIDFVSWLWRLE